MSSNQNNKKINIKPTDTKPLEYIRHISIQNKVIDFETNGQSMHEMKYVSIVHLHILSRIDNSAGCVTGDHDLQLGQGEVAGVGQEDVDVAHHALLLLHPGVRPQLLVQDDEGALWKSEMEISFNSRPTSTQTPSQYKGKGILNVRMVLSTVLHPTLAIFDLLLTSILAILLTTLQL